jgi:anti-sigma B factor antagonist
MSTQSVCAFALETDSDTGITYVTVSGKLDPVAAEDMAPALDEAYRAGARRFVFDLSELVYVGSLGLRVFVGLHNRVRGIGGVALCSVKPGVLKILDMTKLTALLRHYPTRHEAADALTV